MKQCLTLLIALLCFLIEPGTVSAQELPSEVRFGYLNGPRPWILGKIDKSFDEAFGTPVRWRSFESGPPALDALAAGEVDIVRVGSVPATSAIIAQAPIKVIALSGIIDK
ncbi:MAG: taurine ABC transporter substrate-binding protein, partial [Deltaproteobacteria bacterium]|nr:taurine ABC transporter substrate-binding protein [Deltaproteobacteria bacterium]